MATSITVRSLSATQVAVGNRTTPFTVSTSDLANDVRLRKQVATAIENALVFALGDNGQVFSADDVLAMGVVLKDTREDYWEQIESFIGVGYVNPNGVVSLGKGKLLTVGGDLAPPDFTAKLDPWSQVYDNKLDTWTAAPNPPGLPINIGIDGHFGFAVTLKDGRVLAGGDSVWNDSGDNGEKCWIFNPKTNIWTATGDRPTRNRCGGGFTEPGENGVLMKDGRVLLTHTLPHYDNYATDWGKTEIFDPSANGGVGAWTLGANYPIPSTSAGANGFYGSKKLLLPDGRVLCVGGHEVVTGSAGIESIEAIPYAFAYDPKTNTWARLADMLETHNSFDMLDYSTTPPTQLDADLTGKKFGYAGRSDFAIYLLQGSRVLVVGGTVGFFGAPTFNCQIYDIGTNTWRHTDDLPQSGGGFTARGQNSKGDVMAGCAQSVGPYWMWSAYTFIFDQQREIWEQSAIAPLSCVVDGVPAPFATPTIENGGLLNPDDWGVPATDPNGNPYFYPSPAFTTAYSVMISNNESIHVSGGPPFSLGTPRCFKFTFGQDSRKKDPFHKKSHHDSVKAAARRATALAAAMVKVNKR